MDNCKECGKIILSDYRFCPRCGLSIFGDAPKGRDSNDGNEPEGDAASRFFSLARELSEAANIDALLKKIGGAIEEILCAERSSILLLDETGENLYFKTATGEDILKTLRLPIGKGIAGWIAQHRESLLVNDPYSDERFSPETDKKTGFRTKSIAGVPMIFNSRLIGVCEAINKKSGDFTERDIETLCGFSGLAAVSIANLQLRADQKNLYSNLIEFIVMAADSLSRPEPSPRGHAWEMARMAPLMGKELGMPLHTQQLLQRAALIHDIGFLGLEYPELIGINIDRKLNNDARYRLHTVVGSEMIKGIKVMKELRPFISCHHRYRNGEGFPEKISPETITLETEIIAILEDLMLKGDKAAIDPGRYTGEVFEALNKITSG